MATTTANGGDHPKPAPPVASAAERPAITVDDAMTTLSARGRRATCKALSYFDAAMKASANSWSPHNTSGYINLAVAENKLCTELVQARLQSPSARAHVPREAYAYGNVRGCVPLRAALARLLEATSMQGLELDEDHITVLAGAGAVLENVFWAIAGPGDGVIVPAPYYPAFDNDCCVRSSLELLAVHAAPGGMPLPGVAEVDAAYIAAVDKGIPVKALLLTSPHNPTGLLYEYGGLQALLLWAMGRGLHVVADEIYANSVFRGDTGFVSMARVAAVTAAESGDVALAEAIRHRVHVVFGLSKDFCASGLRVGCLHTRNTALNAALDNLSYFSGVSFELQFVLAGVLTDRAWLDGFFLENEHRLQKSYTAVTEALAAAGIPFVAASAGIFVWIDLRVLLPAAATWEDERTAFEALVTEAKVVLTPGRDCHAAVPGFFRCCYAAVPPAALHPAVARIKSVIDRRAAAQAAAQAARSAAAPEAEAAVADASTCVIA